MKAITPVNIWHEGSLKSASLLNVASSYDDLSTYASLSYRILEEVDQPDAPQGMTAVNMSLVVASGTVYMGGQDYIDWDNSNQAAYEFVAEKLNLELVAETQP